MDEAMSSSIHPPKTNLHTRARMDPQVNLSRSVIISLAPFCKTQASNCGGRTVQLVNAAWAHQSWRLLRPNILTRNIAIQHIYHSGTEPLHELSQISLPPSARGEFLPVINTEESQSPTLLPAALHSLFEWKPHLIRTAHREYIISSQNPHPPPGGPQFDSQSLLRLEICIHTHTHTSPAKYICILYSEPHSLDATHSFHGFLGRMGQASIVLASPIHSTAYLPGMFGYVCMYVYVCTWARGPESQITW